MGGTYGESDSVEQGMFRVERYRKAAQSGARESCRLARISAIALCRSDRGLGTKPLSRPLPGNGGCTTTMRKRVALFDVEGTLINCVPQILSTWVRALDESGQPFDRKVLQEYSGMGGSEMLDVLLPRVSHENKRRILQRQGELYRRNFLRRVGPFPGITELFSQLKTHGFALGIATACKEDELEIYDQKAGFLSFVDAVTCGENDLRGKPYPDLFRATLRRLGVQADGLAVGDSPFDAQPARALGLQAIGVLTGGFSRSDLQAAGCSVVLDQVRGILSQPGMLRSYRRASRRRRAAPTIA
jgi:phosphoglycolate phosphatase-like HAD superfamily hydrolase